MSLHSGPLNCQGLACDCRSLSHQAPLDHSGLACDCRGLSHSAPLDHSGLACILGGSVSLHTSGLLSSILCLQGSSSALSWDSLTASPGVELIRSVCWVRRLDRPEVPPEAWGLVQRRQGPTQTALGPLSSRKTLCEQLLACLSASPCMAAMERAESPSTRFQLAACPSSSSAFSTLLIVTLR